ncbi:MAG: glycosyltransferase family protein [Ardenticatenaceae bacterium]
MQNKVFLGEQAKKRILLVQCEWRTWRLARQWSYNWHLGIEEGLAANNVEFFTLTTPWLARAKELCAGKHFDQVWINDLAHFGENEFYPHEHHEAEFAWLTTLAPICVGFLTESLHYSPEELSAFPNLAERKRWQAPFLAQVTHVVASDERDAEVLSSQGKSACWLAFAVPSRYICPHISTPAQNVALFSGTLYGERKDWLEEALQKGLLSHQTSPENDTIHPSLFNLLPGHRARSFVERVRYSTLIYPAYLWALRRLRRRAQVSWLAGMQSGAAVVNLPHLVKGYTTRVVEGMAAGRPVISWQIPDRPRNQGLFEYGREILLYSTADQLASQIEHLLSNPDLATEIAQHARHKLTARHTMERRIEQILHWIESGEEPIY